MDLFNFGACAVSIVIYCFCFAPPGFVARDIVCMLTTLGHLQASETLITISIQESGSHPRTASVQRTAGGALWERPVGGQCGLELAIFLSRVKTSPQLNMMDFGVNNFLFSSLSTTIALRCLPLPSAYGGGRPSSPISASA